MGGSHRRQSAQLAAVPQSRHGRHVHVASSWHTCGRVVGSASPCAGLCPQGTQLAVMWLRSARKDDHMPLPRSRRTGTRAGPTAHSQHDNGADVKRPSKQGETQHMDQLIDLVVQRTGIPRNQAQQAVQVVVGYFKDRLPGPVASQVDTVLRGGTGGGVTDQAQQDLGGMFGQKPQPQP
jgi:hypothetical protein